MMFSVFLFGMMTTSVYVHANPFRRQAEDWCSSGWVVSEMFYECGRKSRRQTGIPVLSTKSQLVSVVNAYCSQVVPATRDCFHQRIASCDPETRLELNNMVNKTGSLCQPGGTQPNAVVSFLLSHLDEETYLQSECTPRLRLNDCYREARQIAAPSVDESTVMSLSLEEIVSLLQTMSKLQSECFVRWFRERADSCPGWRRVSALILLSELDPQYLGLTFPFTKAEISEIFELED